MRRLLVAGLLVLLMLLLHHGAPPVLAIEYPPGWNLVAGPQGSTLSGASGSIFTWQPGDTEYERFPATAPLHGGWGYWAYFPEGGSITLASAAAPALTVAPAPGQFFMLGNPTASAAGVTGADLAYTYTPGGGYQNATAIPPGQGAWVLAGGPITLSAGGVVTAPGQRPPLQLAPEPAAPPRTSAPPARAITGAAAQLQASALNADDLPGYTLVDESPTQGGPPGYAALWVDLNPASSHFAVLSILEAAASLTEARSELAKLEDETRTDPGTTNLSVLGPQAVGDESTAFHYLYRTSLGTLLDDYEVFFIHGTVVVDLDVTDAAGTGSLQRAVGLAVAIDGRLAARFPSGTGSTDVPAVRAVDAVMLKRTARAAIHR